MKLTDKEAIVINSFKNRDSEFTRLVKRNYRVFKEGDKPQCYFCHRFTTDMTEDVKDCCKDCDYKIQNKL